MWNFYKELIHLRKETPALIAGDYQPLSGDTAPYLVFTRTSVEQTCLVVLNFSKDAQELSFDLGSENARIIYSNKDQGGKVNLKDFSTAPFEVLIAEIV